MFWRCLKSGQSRKWRFEAEDAAASAGATVHMPRIGAGLAGGKWDVAEDIIAKRVCQKGIRVFVYDFGNPA